MFGVKRTDQGTEAAAPFPSKARRCVRLINCTGQRGRSGFLGVQSAHPPLCAKKLSVDVSRKREGGSIDVQPGNPLTHSLCLLLRNCQKKELTTRSRFDPSCCPLIPIIARKRDFGHRLGDKRQVHLRNLHAPPVRSATTILFGYLTR